MGGQREVHYVVAVTDATELALPGDEAASPGGAPPASPPPPDPSPRSPARATAARVVVVLRRYPATTGLVLAVLVVGVASGALWRDIHDTSFYDSVAYGLPQLRAGKVWTFATGAAFVPSLILYLPVLALLVLAAGAYERRVGAWRTVAAVVGGQVLGALLAALVLWPFASSDWTWAARLGADLDVGISGGGFAAVGALTAVLQPVWRTRVRVTVSAYLVAMLLGSGLLWDLEHLTCWAVGLVAGPLLVGRLPGRPTLHFGRRTQRSVVALVIATFAISTLVEAFMPGEGGPFSSSGPAEHSAGVTLALAFGALVQLAVADGLRRGRRVAWLLATGLTALTLVGLVRAEPSAERTADLVLSGAQLLLLVATAAAFTAGSSNLVVRRAGRRVAVVAGALVAYTALGFVVLQDDFAPGPTFGGAVAELVARLLLTTTDALEPTTTAARWFVGSIGAIWLVVIVVTAVGVMYSSKPSRPEPDQDERLRELLRTKPAVGSSIEWMLTWRGTTVWTSPDGRTAIGYRVVGSVALCLADPVGPPEDRAAALRAFDDLCFANGWVPCLFAAGEATAALAPEVGWKAVQVAEDGLLALPDLEFRGKAWQDVRTAMNKASKGDVRLEVVRWADAPPMYVDQLRAISQGWVSDKALPEMGFTLGTLAEADDPEVRLHLAVDGDQTVQGFTSWMPVARDGEVVGWTVDLMRRREDGDFRPVMEYLIGASAMQFKEEGYEFISLSAAPLARAPEHLAASGEQRTLQRLLDFLGDALEPYYGFRSLLAFKAKFQPRFEPLYLVFPDEAALAEIGLAIARAYLPDATTWDWLAMARTMERAHPAHGAGH